MKRTRQAFHFMMVILALAFVFAPRFAAAPVTAPHTRIELVAEQSRVVPGRTIHLGLRFQMEKGWHIYWVNPGDSGEPPHVQWKIPAGFQAGAIEWPAPQRLLAPSIVDYGYQNEVLLMAPLRVPENLKQGAIVTIAANVNWLVCREICIPAKAQVELTLPIGGATEVPTSPEEALFSKARKTLPVPAPQDWKFAAISEKEDFVLTIEAAKQITAATFFPLEPEQIKNDAAQTVTPFASGVRLKLVKSDGLLKPIPELHGVIVLASGRAYEIAAPVKN